MTTPGAARPAPLVRLPDLPGGLDAAITAPGLAAIPADVLAAFLGGRRWFGGKGTAPRHVAVRDVIPLPVPAAAHAAAVGAAGTAPLLAVTRWTVTMGDGRQALYQVPLALHAGAPAATGTGAPVLALVETAGGARGFLVDAVGEPAFQRYVAEALERGGEPGVPGLRWEIRPLAGAPLDGLAALPARLGAAEQSNTSLLLGDRAILKLYRRLEAGEHPDVEIARVLTTRTRFAHVPALLGTVAFVDADGAAMVAGMLQALVPGARDAWAVGLDAARAYLRAGGDAPPNPFADEMRTLGRITRELHEALATVADEPAFAPQPATRADVQAWATRVGGMVHESTELLAAARRAGRLREQDVPIADAIVRRRPELLDDIQGLADAAERDGGLRIRHHGDYHLGQVLQGSDGGYRIIDFEGEPARPLEERRALASPLRDVAGMLRSFAYAAASAAMEAGGVGTNPAVETRTARWERGVREAFLAGYLGSTPPAFLPRSTDASLHLLTLFEMEKVFYELAYELNNRPDWVWIPLRGVGRMLGSPAIPRRSGR